MARELEVVDLFEECWSRFKNKEDLEIQTVLQVASVMADLLRDNDERLRSAYAEGRADEREALYNKGELPHKGGAQ